MRYGTILSIVVGALVAFSLLTGCRPANTSGSDRASPSPDQQLRVETPQASWEPIFFRYIDEMAKVGNLPSLRSSVLPNDDLEARFWVELGYFGMDGLVIRKTSGIWSGTYLYGYSRDPKFKKYAEQIQSPRSGWDTAWRRLVEGGLLTMPDASQVQCNEYGKDVPVFVFETNVNRTYRTYLYGDPVIAPCDEAKQMVNLISIINQEFGLQWPTTR